MKELMVHVERVVRSLRAGSARKQRMREELLAHLTHIYDEELARCGDRETALRAALQRFGEPADLTRELQASLPRAEVRAAAWEHWLGRRAGESELRYTLRVTALAALYNAAVFLVFNGAYFLPGGMLEKDPTAAWRLWGGACFLISGTALIVPLGLLYYRVRNALLGGLGESRSWLRAAGWATLAGLTMLVFGLAFTQLVLGDWNLSLELFYIWLPGAVMTPCMMIGFALLHGRAQIRQREWACLDIRS